MHTMKANRGVSALLDSMALVCQEPKLQEDNTQQEKKVREGGREGRRERKQRKEKQWEKGEKEGKREIHPSFMAHPSDYKMRISDCHPRWLLFPSGG